MSKLVYIIIGIFFLVLSIAIFAFFRMAQQEAIADLSNKIDEQKSVNEVLVGEMEEKLTSQQVTITEQDKMLESLKEELGRKEEHEAQVSSENSKSLACSEYNRLQSEIKDTCGIMSYPGLETCIEELQDRYEKFKKNKEKSEARSMESKLTKIQSLKPAYVEASQKCGVQAR